jgi:hypothetical protein
MTPGVCGYMRRAKSLRQSFSEEIITEEKRFDVLSNITSALNFRKYLVESVLEEKGQP